MQAHFGLCGLGTFQETTQMVSKIKIVVTRVILQTVVTLQALQIRNSLVP